jgi:hypothetical protein
MQKVHLRRSQLRCTGALLAILLALVPALAGCGTLDRDAVQTEIQNVESAAAEGALVAHEVERGRTIRSFAEIRTAELHKVAMNASEALQETPAEGDLDSSASRGADLGDRVRGLLEQLHERPTDRTLARHVRLTLDHLASKAHDLADEL